MKHEGKTQEISSHKPGWTNHATRGMKEIMRTRKRKYARYALPEGFAERGYPKDLSCHMTSKNMMGRKNPRCGYQTIFRQYKYLEDQEQQQCKACTYTSPAQHGLG
jgi:hypothetical protein